MNKYKISLLDTDLSAFQSTDIKKTKINIWKNDKACVKILIENPDSKDNTIKFKIKGNDETKNIKIFKIDYTMAYNGPMYVSGEHFSKSELHDLSKRSKSFDVLVPKEEIHFKDRVCLWAEIITDKNIKSGIHTVDIEFLEKGAIIGEVALEIEVFDHVLETNNEFYDIELWQYPYSSAEYFGLEPFSEEHFKTLKKIMTIYKNIGGKAITATCTEDAWDKQTYSKNDIHYPSMIKWIYDGEIKYDYTDFDKWIKFTTDLGFDGKIALYGIAPWHDSFTYWENNKLIYEKFGEIERYEKLWTNFLGDLIDHLENMNILDRVYLGIDEKGFSDKFLKVLKSVKNTKDKTIKLTAAMDNFVDKWEYCILIEDLTIGDNAIYKDFDKFLDLLEIRKKHGYKTTLYSCVGHIPGNFALSEPFESYFTVINACRYTDGFLRWALDAWVENPMKDITHIAFEPGDTSLIYPSEKDFSIYSSVRLEKMAEAVRDMNKLRECIKNKPNEVFEDIKTICYTEDGKSYMDKLEKERLKREIDEFRKKLNRIIYR